MDGTFDLPMQVIIMHGIELRSSQNTFHIHFPFSEEKSVEQIASNVLHILKTTKPQPVNWKEHFNQCHCNFPPLLLVSMTMSTFQVQILGDAWVNSY